VLRVANDMCIQRDISIRVEIEPISSLPFFKIYEVEPFQMELQRKYLSIVNRTDHELEDASRFYA